jgi:hypothetical protein
LAGSTYSDPKDITQPNPLLTILSRTYVIFAVLNVSFIPIIYFFFPETQGLTLEALDSVFDHPERITRGVLDKEHRKEMLFMSSHAAVEARSRGLSNLKTTASAEVDCRESAE